MRGFQVGLAGDTGQAVSYLNDNRPNIIILDVMMPGMDGLTFCQLVREKVNAPILMLTARDSVPDRVAGLEAGADDYLVKPFDFDELVARVRALMRRPSLREPTAGPLTFADVVLDRNAWTATRGEKPLHLTATEFRLLEHFMRLPERVLSREEILTAVWEEEWAGAQSNLIDVHVAKLRQKLEAAGRPRLIQTVRAVGYMLREA